MGEIKLKTESQPEKIIDLKKTIKETHTSEIIIGLCGPIGTDIKFVANSFKKVLEREYSYDCTIIKLSSFIKSFNNTTDFESLKTSNPVKYYDDLIDYGNHLRANHVNSILAELAINEIAVKREEELIKTQSTEYGSNRHCYIIDSIKNTEELELFKLVYRDLFYMVGTFSSLDNRVKSLQDMGIKLDEVHKIIDRDSSEKTANGQKVVDTFIESDLFLRIDKSTYHSIEPKIKRFCNLILNSDIVTPSSNETAMYLAAASAGNSACLSRQVGASITDKDGQVISVGWNDVPKAGGGVYQFSETDLISQKDHRCMNLEGGKCFNDKEKDLLTEVLVGVLVEDGIIAEGNRNDAYKTLRNSKIKELIEFSRSVHAEMLAIINASQKSGADMKGGKLFCTTYPCHNCARHIIAAGISEVYYIEPYKKSLAIKLHHDSITEDESKESLVRILLYEGISPSRYLEFFKMIPNSRKSSGIKSEYLGHQSKPKNTLSLQAIPILEKKVTEDLKNRNLLR